MMSKNYLSRDSHLISQEQKEDQPVGNDKHGKHDNNLKKKQITAAGYLTIIPFGYEILDSQRRD